jgi:hypothetical protein
MFIAKLAKKVLSDSDSDLDMDSNDNELEEFNKQEGWSKGKRRGNILKMLPMLNRSFDISKFRREILTTITTDPGCKKKKKSSSLALVSN